MIKKLTSFASSHAAALKSSMRMGKAPIFLKHRAKKVGRAIKKQVKNQYNLFKDFPGAGVGAAAVGIGLGSGISYLASKPKKEE
jgi:hypothetical protein